VDRILDHRHPRIPSHCAHLGQTIVPPTVTATLYFVIFGSLIGQRWGWSGLWLHAVHCPGLIMMTVITNSYGNVVSSFFGAKFASISRSFWSRRFPTG